MGSIREGVFGGFSGKVGNLVGSHWKSVDYMRTLPKPSTKAATEKQQVQRARFALAVKFARPISSLLDVGYRQQDSAMSGYNASVRQILKEAITGTYPDLQLDYSKIRISEGTLTGIANGKAVSTTPGSLQISWTDNTGDEGARSDDELAMLIVNPDKGTALFKSAAALRSTGTLTEVVPDTFSSDEVEVFAFFVGANGKEVSDSLYLGKQTIY